MKDFFCNYIYNNIDKNLTELSNVSFFNFTFHTIYSALRFIFCINIKFMNEDNDKASLKKFFIKLIAITFSIIIKINNTYNLNFAENFESINKLLSLSDKESVELIKNTIRSEMKKGLLKDKIINDKDKILLYKFYLKVKNEFQEIEK